MKSIIFVCLGNICRSPIADGIARQIVEQNSWNVLVDSAGTGSWHIGETPCENSIRVSKNHGLDISGLRARQVQKSDFEKFELVVALDDNNWRDLKALGATNIVKLGDYGYDGADIPDPYFFDGFEGFEKVYEMIDVSVHNLFKEHYESIFV